MGVGIKNITKEKHRHKIGASSFVACHRRKKKKKKSEISSACFETEACWNQDGQSPCALPPTEAEVCLIRQRKGRIPSNKKK